MAHRPATALDVAKRAGVSRSAVSMVFNGHADGNVAKESQHRILAAAEELSYKPNSIAVSLRNQRTHTLGIITDEIVTSPFAGRLVSGASNAAMERGYMVLVIDSEGAPGRDVQAIEALRHRRVDGLIYATGGLQAFHPPAQLLSQPAAMANCYDPDDDVLGVVPDEVEGGYAAAKLLLDLGHREIALLGGRDNPAVPLREQGYRRAMTEFGVAQGQQVVSTGWDIDQGYHAAAAVLSGRDRPTAIVCANDRVATGVLLYAAAAGIRVPEQLSVVGYDDQQHVAANLVPSLTTIALPHAEIGAEAVTRVLDALQGRGGLKPSGPVLIPCPVVERDSTGPVPS
ncbi:LacI family DNA-binding transcriptional regulator [Arthrobacter pigmenti]